MEEHIDLLEQYIKQKITRLRPREPFDYMFSQLPVISRKGANKGKVSQIGRGWPFFNRRWCTGRKQEAINCHANALTYRSGMSLPIVQCVGFAFDEQHRAEAVGKGNAGKHVSVSYPLIDACMTEKEALSFCYERGFTWGGLYKIFDRLSCYCCPLGGERNARKVWEHFPSLWQRMLEMESWLPEGHKGRRFTNTLTVSDLDKKFNEAKRQPKQGSLLEGKESFVAPTGIR